MPKRIQRKRLKGWRLPEGARCVTRPGKFGNPFSTAAEFDHALRVCLGRGGFQTNFANLQHMLRIAREIDELRGLDLACYCELDKPCHADTLLELANA